MSSYMENIWQKAAGWTFDNLAFWTLTTGFLLLPWFNLPFWSTPLDVSKRFLIVIIVFLAFILWLLGRLQAGRIVIPRNLILVGVAAVSLTTLISTIFSGTFWNSFTGLGFETDTFLSVFGLSLLLFLFSLFFQTKKRILSLYLGLFVSTLIVFALEILALFILRTDLFPWFKPLFNTFFNGLFISLVGKWFDLGIYFGFIALSALVMLELLPFKEMPFFKRFLWICFSLSLVALVFINYFPVWVVLGIFAMAIFVYKISFGNFNQTTNTSTSQVNNLFLPSFLVVLLALLFIIMGGSDKLGGRIDDLQNRLTIPITDVRPSWSGTWEITKNALWHNPLLGAGPNNFVAEWVKYKPAAINKTIYWNIDFRSGVGSIPSTLVTSGLLGLASWLFLLGTVLWYGFKFVFSWRQDRSTKALLILSFSGAVYLWIFTVIYNPDNTLWAMTFIVTGLFVAMLTEAKITSDTEFSLVADPRVNFVSILLFVVLIIGSITTGYLMVQKYFSVYLYQQGLYRLNVNGNIDQAGSLINRAINLSGQDTYYRAMADINIVQISRLLNEQDIPKEELRARFLSTLDAATKNAQAAVNFNDKNYLNWLALGKVYEAVVPLNITGAYEEGNKAFARAQILNPTNPSILLDYFARLEISKKNISKAKEYIKESLSVKNDYAPAISLLSQIDVEQGNTSQAVNRLKEFLNAFPQNVDAGFLFQLGLLQYNQNDYQIAADTLIKAIQLSPSYSNAKYFLGLSYSALGDYDKALEQFQDIAKTNPDNQEVKQIIYNLQIGRPALSGLSKVAAPTATTTAAKKQ